MPPCIRPSNVSSSIASCSSIRPRSIPQPARAARDFSQSSSRQITKRRRQFYQWLNGPGRALKEPLPGSTNYLGAYDRFGNLIRADNRYLTGRKKKEEAEEGEDEAASKSGQEADETDMTERRLDEAAENEDKKQEELKLPPESKEDLRPFPGNKYFQSQPVLSEDLREAIYQAMVDPVSPMSLPAASVHFGVSNERIGAVYRLKHMEKEWIAKGKTLAIPYRQAVMDMLPKTPYVSDKNKRPIPHEPINDLIVHPATRQQLFVPVAESRVFTRVDAGKAFDNNLLPADERIPHPEMVQVERDTLSGMSAAERFERAKERLLTQIKEKTEKEEAAKEAEKAALTRVPRRRWDFVIQNVSVESVGKNGRDHRGVGWRYGLPHEDRKKGQVKIPTSVEA
ncbi:hypothetical protein DM02DRAFT_617014 [Periconia macrospinosa]|uniref:Ribosomal protein S35, mitochondrial n=1 Tax=Periconia macrospinosa TaxID=97972 RepID=A0A2V1DEY9_9PLEO|nr:hypothetical protein DM02DRAFT_617014 [Periconia macrospinosa]